MAAQNSPRDLHCQAIVMMFPRTGSTRLDDGGRGGQCQSKHRLQQDGPARDILGRGLLWGSRCHSFGRHGRGSSTVVVLLLLIALSQGTR